MFPISFSRKPICDESRQFGGRFRRCMRDDIARNQCRARFPVMAEKSGYPEDTEPETQRFDDSGRVLPEVIAGRRRGVLFGRRQWAERPAATGYCRTRAPGGLPRGHLLDRPDSRRPDLIGLSECYFEVPDAAYVYRSNRSLRYDHSITANARENAPAQDYTVTMPD